MTGMPTAPTPSIVVSSTRTRGRLLDGDDAAVARGAAAVFGEMSRAFRGGRPELGLVLAGKARAYLGHMSGRTASQLVPSAADSANVAATEGSSISDEVAIYDTYFGLGRALNLSTSQQLLTALPTMADVAACLGHRRVPLQLDESAQLAELIGELLVSSSADIPPLTRLNWTDRQDVPLLLPAPLLRWKIGHRMYALANRAAAHALDAALNDIVKGRTDSAAHHVRLASHRTRSITAAMQLAASMSSQEYVQLVRPTMAPPGTPFELTGAMNLDHAAYRAALARFLTVAGEPVAAMRRESDALADARSALLHADLNDLEQHIALTYRLVGDVAALDEHETASAVQGLRGMYQARTSSYHHLFRIAPAHAAPGR